MFNTENLLETALSTALFVIVGMAVIAIALGMVYRRRSGRATTSASLKGKTVVITGASSGNTQWMKP